LYDGIVSITLVSLEYANFRLQNIEIKKIAKEEIKTHFGLIGDLCVIALHIWQM